MFTVMRSAFLIFSVVFFMIFSFFSTSSVRAAVPVVINPIPDQTATEGNPFDMSIKTYEVFKDPDNNNLGITIKQADGSDLPKWLTLEAGPVSPRIVGEVTITSSGETSEVAVAGNYAYTSTNGVLKIIDISNSTNPIIVGSTSLITTDDDVGIAVSGNYAYMVDLSYLNIVDISNPTTPKLISRLPLPSRLAGNNEILVSGDHAYVTSLEPCGFGIINISNPNDPNIASTIYFPPRYCCETLGLAGDYVYITIAFIEGAPPKVKSSFLQIIDVSNSTAPNLEGVLDTKQNDPTGNHIATVGNYAYTVYINRIPHYVSDLKIINISDPISPHLINTTSISKAEISLGVQVSGNYAYMTTESLIDIPPRLVVVDISDPISPRLINDTLNITEPTKSPLGSVASGMAVVGDHAYIILGSFETKGFLRIIGGVGGGVRLKGVPDNVGQLNLTVVANNNAGAIPTNFSINVKQSSSKAEHTEHSFPRWAKWILIGGGSGVLIIGGSIIVGGGALLITGVCATKIIQKLRKEGKYTSLQ